jgi:16S rRNA (guanine966-N2)-methyltransferase
MPAPFMLKPAMRVIAGTLRSRRLDAPAGLDTRPTSDRLRETLFNVLNSRIEGARFLDLYAGSGAVGIEAISRGAAHCVFVEHAPAAQAVLRKNLSQLGISSGYRIHPGAAAAWLRRAQAGSKAAVFDLVFLDPPYAAAEEYATALALLGGTACSRLSEGALVIAEHRRKDKLAEAYGALRRTRLLEQGDAALSFYARAAQE